MPAILKKALVKWSTIAVLGISAYFLGYFWGLQKLGPSEPERKAASEEAPADSLQEAAEFGKLK